MERLFDGDNLVESIVRNQFVNIRNVLEPVIAKVTVQNSNYMHDELFSYLAMMSNLDWVDMGINIEITDVQQGHMLIHRILDKLEMFWRETKNDQYEYVRELAFACEHIIRDCLFQLMDAVESALEFNETYDDRYSKLLGYIYKMTLIIYYLSEHMGMEISLHDSERFRLMRDAMSWINIDDLDMDGLISID